MRFDYVTVVLTVVAIAGTVSVLLQVLPTTIKDRE